jgi:uroporphyrinogen-III synthase
VKALVDGFAGRELPLIAAFGAGTTRKAIESGLTVSTMAPTPEVPSMARALDIFIGEFNAGRETEPVASPEMSRQAEEFVKAHQTKEMKRARAKKKAAAKKS